MLCHVLNSFVTRMRIFRNSKSLFLGQQALKVLAHVWGERSAEALSLYKAYNVLKIGQVAYIKNIFSLSLLTSQFRRLFIFPLIFFQLVNFKWKLSSSVRSSSSKSLNRTFITVEIAVADAASNLATHSFEMNVSEFQNFSKKLRDMGNVLEMSS